MAAMILALALATHARERCDFIKEEERLGTRQPPKIAQVGQPQALRLPAIAERDITLGCLLCQAARIRRYSLVTRAKDRLEAVRTIRATEQCRLLLRPRHVA